MSQPSERLRRLGRHITSIFTGLAAGPRNILAAIRPCEGAPGGQGEDETEGPRRRTEAAPGREGDEPPRRHADAAPREAATGEAEQAREGAAGRPAPATPEDARGSAAAATEAPGGQGEDETEGPRRRTEAAPGREGDEPPRRHADAAPREAATGEAEQAREGAAGRPAPATPEDARGSVAAATEAAARPERGSGERANPAAPQDLPGGRSPADVRWGITRESRRTGDSQGVTERASEPPPRVAAPRHGQVGDLRNRVDQVVNDQARIAQQLVQLSDQARAAWRAAREATRQLQQVNRNALKR